MKVSFFSLALRSASYRWKSHLGVLLGAAVGALVLTGAFVVGDSVRGTLRAQAEARLGRVAAAWTTGEYFASAAPIQLEHPSAAALLMLDGTVATPDDNARANRVQLMGVDSRFGTLSPSGSFPTPTHGQAVVNHRLARQLGAKPGTELVVTFEKPGLFSKDAPLSGEEEESRGTLRVTVSAVAGDAEFGRFSLVGGQVPPLTIYVPLETLQAACGRAGMSNLILFPTVPSDPRFTQDKRPLSDAAIQIRAGQSGIELRSERVFLNPAVVAAAPKGVDALTYFVSEIRSGERSTPYSMVTALDAPASGFLPAELAADEITITRWLAEDLNVKEGDRITLRYLVASGKRQLAERERTFTVLSILEMSEKQLNGSWMPDFPGLKDAKNCRDWKPGFDVDTGRIRAKDNEYWERYQGTPKAFVNLAVGQEMWGNRWGNLTAIRYPHGPDAAAVETALRKNLSPASLGFRQLALRADAAEALRVPVDFGQLFTAFSFFLIIAACALTGMLFAFSLLQRASEAGLLLAVGLRESQVRRLFLVEGTILAVVGSALGAFAASGYSYALLQGLGSVWKGAIGETELRFLPMPSSYIAGMLSGTLIAVASMAWTARGLFRQSARELLQTTGVVEAGEYRSRRSVVSIWVGITGVVGAIVCGAYGFSHPSAFFGAGALLLVAGLATVHSALTRIATSETQLASLAQLARRNSARRRGRSLVTLGTLASGMFLVVAVDSFRKAEEPHPFDWDSGTGGFALMGESASPVYEDLNSEQGRNRYGIDPEAMNGVRVQQLRLRDGDDASCLNLNRAVRPRILGVNPADFTGHFRFTPKNAVGWQVLNTPPASDDAIPAVVDQNTLLWALQKQLGDTLEYQDEQGRNVRLRLVAALDGTVLQGSVVIAEEQFTRLFPNDGGYRAFFVEATPQKSAAVRQELTKALADRGLSLTEATVRLDELHAVENTYLAIFQSLAGLALLLGTAGVGIVVGRNVVERRSEFALLEAVGYPPELVRHTVVLEHGFLVWMALLIGGVSAAVAMIPHLSGAVHGDWPWQGSLGLLLALGVLGSIWVFGTTRILLKGSSVKSLRAE